MSIAIVKYRTDGSSLVADADQIKAIEEQEQVEQEAKKKRYDFLRSPPCKYCAGSGYVNKLEDGTLLQAGIIAFGPVFEGVTCPVCKGISHGEPYGTDRRPYEKRGTTPDGRWLLIEDTK